MADIKTYPFVSICVPIYGVEKYIKRCARSLFAQTYPNIEYIFVDDCGKDRSMEILNQIIAEYPKKNVQVIHHGCNRGLAAARNTAVAMAKGEFIMHVDSDDWLEENAVDLLVNRQVETDADIVSGNAVVHYRDRTENLIEPDYANVNEMVHQTIKLSIDHVMWRRIIRKSLYTEHNICAVEGVDIGEDHHTLPRLVFYAKSIAKVDKVVYHYNCMNENSYMRVNQSQRVNMRKYCCDRDSINILRSFFNDEDESCVKELCEMKIEYAYRTLWNTLKMGDRDAFDVVGADMKSVADYAETIGWTPKHVKYVAEHYYLCWLKVRMLILVKKLTGRRNYKL